MRFRNNQQGNVDPLLIPLIVSVVLVVGLGGFGIWAYTSFLSERDTVDEQVAAAVQEAEAAQAVVLEADFAEREKNPYRTYRSDASIGSIEITYPRTWSGYVDEDTGGSKPLTAFFHPSEVPADDATRFAIRVTVDESDYTKAISEYEDEIEDGTVRSRAITVAEVTGIRFDGQIGKDFTGAMVVFPLRDKTVKVWTESDSYLSDFNDIILANLTFEK